MDQEKLVALFQAEFERCNLKETETAVVLSGDRTPAYFARAALRAIRNLGAQGFQMHMPAPISKERAGAKKEGSYVGLTAVTGQTLALESLKKADFVVDLLLLLHSPEQVEILNAGTRMLLIVEPPEILESRIPTDELRRQVEESSEVLKRARTLHISSPAGTDVTMALGEYPVITQYGLTDTPGRWDHWPSAFLYTWPNEGGTNGRVVLNTGDFIWPLNRYLETPVTLTIHDGYIRNIEGEADAQILRDQMASFEEPMRFRI
jgi:2,5-dihydroxypyridine 5,6-dioxygenase